MKRQKTKQSISAVLAIFMTVVYSVPLYIAITNAFKSYDAIVQNPLSLPNPPTLQNFVNAWQKAQVPVLYKNSLIITAGSLLVLVLTASMAAYVVSRNQTRLFQNLNVFFLFGMMVPVQVILIPSIKTLDFLHLLRTMPGMILFNTAAYFSISFFLYAQFFHTLPVSIEESAMIDGASRFTIYSRILFPLLKPCTSTVLIFSGMWIWNDFLPPLYILDAKTGSTITTGIYRAIGQYTTNWEMVFASVMLASVPVVIVYFLMQKQFVHGLAAGAVKG